MGSLLEDQDSAGPNGYGHGNGWHRRRLSVVNSAPYILFLEPLYYCNLDCPLCDKGGDCRTEHRQGTIWGNVVLNCPAEPGLYLFQAEDTLVAGNIVVGTAGIAALGIETNARISGNTLDGAIAVTGGATVTGFKDNVILSAAVARRHYLLPLTGKAPIKGDDTLAQAAKRIAAYRAYREALTKR